MNVRLIGKKALVTGAGKGIGRSICKRLVDCGAKTFALSRTEADLDSLKAELPSVHTINQDLRNWDKVREEIAKIETIDLLVNNAGICHLSKFIDTSKEDLERLCDINLKSVFHLSQIVCKEMIKQGNGGAIVNVSSGGGKKVTKQFSAYCCTKAALDMLTKCMTVELGRYNIRVNAVNPTIVWTQLTLNIEDYIKKRESSILNRMPLGQFPEISDVVDAVVYLLSDQSRIINGECISIDGGLARA